MNATLKSLMGALATALALWSVAGCGGSPCDKVKCNTNEACNATTGACEAAGQCKGVKCPAGTGCAADTGACKNLCTGVATPPTCTLPLACNPVTGTCADLCAGVTCDKATDACKPLTGKCVDRCVLAACTPEQSCEANSGACSAKCESDKKPAGKVACGDLQKCKKTTGACVSLCDGVVCALSESSYAQWCDDATGSCKSGAAPAGRPGAACSADGDCHVANAAEGQEFSCLQETLTGTSYAAKAVGGYCAASCGQTMACPQGSNCLNGACYDQCAKDTECRNTPEYRCSPIGSAQFVCLPAAQCTKANAADCAGVGGDCASDGDCISGANCETEMRAAVDASGRPTGQMEFSGWDKGYCAWSKRKGDACPPHSTPVGAGGPTDKLTQICLKDCTVEITPISQGLGTPEECGLGEACLQLAQNSPAGVCVPPEIFGAPSCNLDADCQATTCTTADKTGCGKNQPCTSGSCRKADKCAADADCAELTTGVRGKCDTVKGECFNNYCEPTLNQCIPDCTLIDVLGDTDGACAGKTCPAGQLCSKASNGACISGVCPTGTTCNGTTKRCDRACTRDLNCGASGICDNALCVAACTSHNEAKVCGADKVCNADTGHCLPKCTTDSACGDGGACVTSSGRCIRKCNVEINPLVCGAADVCDDATGKCTAKCTSVNDTVVCKQKFCQSSTAKCLANCSADASICGAEKCSVDGTTGNAWCGLDCRTDVDCGTDASLKGPVCTTDATCGVDANNAPLKCLSEAGATTKHCPSTTALHCGAVTGSTVKRCQ